MMMNWFVVVEFGVFDWYGGVGVLVFGDVEKFFYFGFFEVE